MADNFTNTLAKLQASNLMSGFAVSGQAALLNARTEGTREVINNFSKRLQEIEADPLTTEEQLQTLNADAVVTEEMVDIQDQLSKFASFSVNTIKRQEEINRLYGGTIQQLGLVGGEDAGNLANILQTQQGIKIDELEKQRRLPFETQAYQQSLYQVETAKLNLMEGKIKLEDLKSDREVAGLMSQMLTTEDFGKLNLAYNTATGKNKFNLGNFRDNMFLRFGDNPKFAKAWAGIDEYIRNHTRTYRPNFTKVGSGSGRTVVENLSLVKNKYMELVDMTKRMGDLRFGDGYQWARDEYMAIASSVFGEDVQKHQDKFKFGVSPDVISKMEGDSKQIAEEVYNVLYNHNSEDYYNKHYKNLGNLLTFQYGQYTPVTPYFKVGSEANPYPLVDGTNLDPTKIMVPLDVGTGRSLFDKSIGRTNPLPTGGGYYDPFDPETFIDYQGAINEKRKEMLQQNTGNEKIEIPSNFPLEPKF